MRRGRHSAERRGRRRRSGEEGQKEGRGSKQTGRGKELKK